RAHDRADRARGAQADRRGRSERGPVGRHPGQAVPEPRSEGGRRPAAARPEAQAGAVAGGVVRRIQAAREGRRGGRAGRRRRGAPRAPPLSTEPSASRSSGATFVALFVAALAIWFIVRVVEVLLLVFIAVLCGVYLSAITDLLERRFRLKRWIGLASAVVATVAAVVGIGALLVPPVIDQTQALISGLPQTLTKIQNVLAAWARVYPVLFPTELANPASGLVGGLI